MVISNLLFTFAFMKTFINYILYGFYQIDYIFGDRRYLYNIGTGGVLFLMSVHLYIFSALVLIVGWGIQNGFIKLYSDKLLEILFFIIIIIVVIWWYYWLNREKYKSSFEKLDKEPSLIRWVCFILALLWGIGGIVFLYRSIIYLHTQTTFF